VGFFGQYVSEPANFDFQRILCSHRLPLLNIFYTVSEENGDE
jgi:hypothetical protein